MCPPAGSAVAHTLLSPPALQLSGEIYELHTSLLTKSVQETRSAVSGGEAGLEFMLRLRGRLSRQDTLREREGNAGGDAPLHYIYRSNKEHGQRCGRINSQCKVVPVN